MGDIRNVGGSFLQYEKSFGRPMRRRWNQIKYLIAERVNEDSGWIKLSQSIISGVLF